MGGDWSRPVVHWEILARDPERQAAFYRELFHWEIGEGPVMTITPGIGGPEPGPGGHIRKGDESRVSLYVQVLDLTASLGQVEQLGGRVAVAPFAVPGGPTIAFVEDPEGLPLALVQQ
ncbi:MAG TPA: VOC family protein [Acidimicrobiales bacterium]|nr:VOC family protein [Acidimicrobiales bacterium]